MARRTSSFVMEVEAPADPDTRPAGIKAGDSPEDGLVIADGVIVAGPFNELVTAPPPEEPPEE